MEDSGCFWGRIPHGFSDLAENENQYERLEVKMNQLYHRSHEELEEIKLPVLEQGQVIINYMKTSGNEIHIIPAFIPTSRWCGAQVSVGLAVMPFLEVVLFCSRPEGRT